MISVQFGGETHDAHEAMGSHFIDWHGVIYGLPIGADEDEWFELTAPDSQGFLDELNAKFGTDLQMEDFDGR